MAPVSLHWRCFIWACSAGALLNVTLSSAMRTNKSTNTGIKRLFPSEVVQLAERKEKPCVICDNYCALHLLL